MIMNQLLTKFFGTSHEREVKKLLPVVESINQLEPGIQKLDDSALVQKSRDFRQTLSEGKTLDDILQEAFAVCREAGDRRLGILNILKPEFEFDLSQLSEKSQSLVKEGQKQLEEGLPIHQLYFPASLYQEVRKIQPESRFPFRYRPFDVQILGGIVLHQGKIAEMKTGEGKTVVATMPVYLNALSGKGVHVVTVNDYLARRDAHSMGELYKFLDLSVGVVLHGMNEEEKKQAYLCDVTYGQNNEFGFDYLRDNMSRHIEECVQRDLNFAIVDEVDSILIDEARTPLIISGPAAESTDKYRKANHIIKFLKAETHYTVDEKDRIVNLTDEGVSLCEKQLGLENLYGDLNTEWVHHINQALKAHVLFKRDVDYVVRDRQVIIVDEFTGRLQEGRRYSEGLHQAIEARENVPIARENQTLATITFQNYFRMYNKLSGMTGTADTEATEFYQIYKLKVVVVPTNKPMIRIDNDDQIYKTRKEKLVAISKDIKGRFEKGQPVLVGTVSIEKSEELSRMLDREGVPHEVLNAKNHQREALIVKDAGHKGKVTIATNMAGRGTDIVLGEGVLERGGLYVLATERHESRRIDNQLRGRSGRQGDPGESLFYLSLEDDLLRIFGSERISKIMDRLGLEEGEVISHSWVNKSIANAQKRVEGQNYEIRKHLLEYDDVMNRQRTVIYKLRRRILKGEEIKDEIQERLEEAIDVIVSRFAMEGNYPENWELDKLYDEIKRVFNVDYKIPDEVLGSQTPQVTVDEVIETVKKHYDEIEESVSKEQLREIERQVLLMVIDNVWREHLYAMDHLKEAIRYRAYSQRDPLQEYKREGFSMFEGAMERIAVETVQRLMHIDPEFRRRQEEAMQKAREIEDLRRQQMQFQGAGEPVTGPAGNIPQAQRTAPPQGARVRVPVGAASAGISAGGKPQAQGAPPQPALNLKNVGRNDPCPCGSGKKFKKCHGADL